MKFSDKSRESGKAIAAGIADLDAVTRQSQYRDRLPRGRAVSFGNKHPERSWNLRCHAPSLSVSRPLSLYLMTQYLMTQPSPHVGALRAGCHAAVFMDK